MELRESLRVLRRRVWIPILLMIVTVVTAGVAVYFTKPEYTATATILARNQGGATISNFVEVATSNSLALRVLEQLGLPRNLDQLSVRLRVTSGRTSLYKVSVTDPSPDHAAILANAVAKQAAQLYQELAAGTKTPLVAELEKDRASLRDRYMAAARALVEFNIQHPETAAAVPAPRDVTVGAQAMQLRVDEAAARDGYLRFEAEVSRARFEQLSSARGFAATVVDEAAAKPDTRARYLKVLYAAVLALILGIGLVFGLEYFDNSIREPEAVEELVGAPVVGIIPRGSARTLKPAKGGVQ
jgi:capsular polysaccharide biosynthesis protein